VSRPGRPEDEAHPRARHPGAPIPSPDRPDGRADHPADAGDAPANGAPHPAHRPGPPSIAWCALAALLVAGTLLAQAVPATAIDWQPGLAWRQPWRWWSAAFVHYSPAHLAGNLLATVLVGAYGWAARAPLAMALAWWVAWPLTHLALAGQADLPHYGGLSGLMHAGVAIVNVHLLANGQRAQRFIGGWGAVLLVAKVVSETPWRGGIQHSPDWDIAIAPVAHLSGLLAGLACGVVGEVLRRRLGRAKPA